MVVKKRRKKVDRDGIPLEGFFFHEPSHTYWLDGNPLQGVTSVLGVISKPMLVPWAARMATEYIADFVDRSKQSNIDLNSVDWVDALKEASKAHTKKKEDAASKGTDLHAQVEEYINRCISENAGKPFVIHEPDNSNLEAFTYWAIKNEVTFIASEAKLYHKELALAGTCDIIFEKEGKLWVGDIKTYKKIWDRVPMFQMAAYGMMWEAMPDTKPVSGYCVVCLPKERLFDEEQDVKWSYDVKGDREAFLAALTLYRTLKNWNN